MDVWYAGLGLLVGDHVPRAVGKPLQAGVPTIPSHREPRGGVHQVYPSVYKLFARPHRDGSVPFSLGGLGVGGAPDDSQPVGATTNCNVADSRPVQWAQMRMPVELLDRAPEDPRQRRLRM